MENNCMKLNCNHIFESVSPGINHPSCAKCIYCDQIGDDPVRTEHLPIQNDNFPIDYFVGIKSPFFEKIMLSFNNSDGIIFNDPAHAVFLGHDLNHK